MEHSFSHDVILEYSKKSIHPCFTAFGLSNKSIQNLNLLDLDIVGKDSVELSEIAVIEYNISASDYEKTFERNDGKRSKMEKNALFIKILNQVCKNLLLTFIDFFIVATFKYLNYFEPFPAMNLILMANYEC